MGSDIRRVRGVGGAPAPNEAGLVQWLRSAAGGLPAALIPIAVGLAPIALPHLAIAIGVAATIGGAAGAAADRHAREEFEGFCRLVGRVADRVRRHRKSLSDEQVADLIGRSDVLRLMGEARDRLAVAEMNSRLRRFADVLAGRVLGHGRDFDLDLHLSRAALELNDAAVEFLRHVEKVQLIARPGAFGGTDIVGYCDEHPPADEHALQQLELGVMAAERFGLLFEDRSLLGGGRNQVRLNDGEVSQTLSQRWMVPHWGGEFLARIRDAEPENDQ